MMMKWTCAALAAGALAFGASAQDETCPLNENVRGHENTEWSIAYAFHLTDAQKTLPRVLLVGDSICNGYQGNVAKRLDKQVNVSYWVSSYCVTSPGYLKMLDFYLSEAQYDVVHFNNGLHSLGTGTNLATYERRLEEALRLVQKRQPKAKIVLVASTSVQNEGREKTVLRLNAAAAKVAAKVGVPFEDLHAVSETVPRETRWRDGVHFGGAGYDALAASVEKYVRAALAK